MRVIVDACTSRCSASAVTVCGPRVASTTSVRNCGSVTSSLTDDERARGDRDERAARTHQRVDDRIGCRVGHVDASPFIGIPSSIRRAHGTSDSILFRAVGADASILRDERSADHCVAGLTAGGAAAYTGPMADLEARLLAVLGAPNVLVGDAINDDYTHDEALTATPVRPLAVVRPGIDRRGRGRRARSATSSACPSPRAVRAPACRARACRAPTASCSRSNA